jgi:hypothetical protein
MVVVGSWLLVLVVDGWCAAWSLVLVADGGW